MRYANSRWMLCGLPILAGCALGDDASTTKLEEPLVLTAATPVATQGLLDFGTKVFAESPSSALPPGAFHGYEFTGRAGGVVTITMTAGTCGTPDTLVHLFGPEGARGDRGADLVRSDDGTGLPCSTDSRIAGFTLPVNGSYLIVATSFSQRGGGSYALTLTCDNDACALPGEMTFARSRIAQTEIDRGAVTGEQLFDIGDFLFETVFRVEDGLGNALVGTPAGSTTRPNFRRVHQGAFGAPEAQSCIACHNVGGDDGAGDRGHDIFQIGDGVTPSSGLERNAPVVLGLGLRQQIGIEMTADLQAQLASAKTAAASRGTAVTVALASKGVSFGTIVASPNGTVDTTGVLGVDPDLVVKPFGWKGREATLRRFVEGGFRVHFGMQTAPSIAKHCASPDPSTFGTGANCRDPDGDGVVDEITEGQLTAMAVYMGLREAPVRVRPLDETARNRTTVGELLFGSAGCASCHVARMRLASPVHVEPADTTGGAGITLDLATQMKSPHPGRNLDGSMSVELWSDFKRHDLGSALADSKPFKAIPPGQFLTTPLWGVATSPPYLHDGRAPTLRDAILAHGGEATASRAAFEALSEDDRQKILEFLGTLGRESETVQASLPEGVDLSGFTLRQTSSSASFVLPAGTVVRHGGFVVVARNTTRPELEAFYHRTLGPNVVFINSGGRFPSINGGETFSLANLQGAVVDGPTIAQPSGGLQNFQRTTGGAPASERSSWILSAAQPSAATPGAGQASTGQGRIYISEIADAAGAGTFGFELVELFVE